MISMVITIVAAVVATGAAIGTGVVVVKGSKSKKAYNEAVSENYIHSFGVEKTYSKHPELMKYAKRAGKKVRKNREEKAKAYESVSDATL